MGEETELRNDFSECGTIIKFRLPRREDGSPKGIAFIQYSDAKGVTKALEFNQTDYGGRTIAVEKAGEGGKGKGEDGDKGKGKGNGKGKKGKKGKKGGDSDSEGFGGKNTFDDSDDDAPPPKKKKVAKKKPASEDSDE